MCVRSADYFGLLTCTWEFCGRCPARWDHVYECTSAVPAALLALGAGSRAMLNCLNHSEKKTIMPVVLSNIPCCYEWGGWSELWKNLIIKIFRCWPFHDQICLLKPKFYQGAWQFGLSTLGEVWMNTHLYTDWHELIPHCSSLQLHNSTVTCGNPVTTSLSRCCKAEQ
jgi:hypothetical protein